MYHHTNARNDQYVRPSVNLSGTLLLAAIGVIVGTSILIFSVDAMAADTNVRIARPAATVDSRVNSSANVGVGPVAADTTLRTDTDAELRSDRDNVRIDSDSVNNDAEDRVFNTRSDMNNTVKGPLWSQPGTADDPDNVTGTVRNDIRSTARGKSNAGSISTGANLNVGVGGSR